MPSLVDDALAAVGLYARDIDPGFSVPPVAPTYRAEFATRGGLDVFSNEDMMADEFACFDASDSTVIGYRKLRTWLQSLFNACFDNFMSRSSGRAMDLFTGPGALRDLTTLLRLGAFGTPEPKICAFLEDTDLTRVFGFQALYAGVSPAKTRTAYDCIPYMDTLMGVYYPHSPTFGSDIDAVSELLVEAVRRASGTIDFGVDITGLRLDEAGFASAITTATGERPTDAIIAATGLPVV